MTDRIRTTITITPEVHEVFSRMADTAGISLGRCIGDWLGDTIEGAQFVAHKMAEARRAPAVVMREMQAFSRGLVDEVDTTAEALRRAAGRSASAARPAGGTSKAPSSNTGLNPPTRTPPRPAARKGRRS